MSGFSAGPSCIVPTPSPLAQRHDVRPLDAVAQTANDGSFDGGGNRSPYFFPPQNCVDIKRCQADRVLGFCRFMLVVVLAHVAPHSVPMFRFT
jgi:hypothetical protein